MPTYIVLIRNASTVLSDDQVKAVIPALQNQVSNDFAPHWGVDATLLWDKDVPTVDPRRASAFLLVFLDDADQAGALGYHDLQKNGQPIGKVFAKTTITYGGKWTVTASHELLEMLADPWINSMAMDALGHYAYCVEVGDAVEADELGYEVDGVTVSDFVLPMWFDPMASHRTRFAFKTALPRPFALASGGYIGVLDTRSGRWSQHTQADQGVVSPYVLHGQAAVAPDADTARKTYDEIPRPGSRRERRTRGHAKWQRSTLD